MGLTCQPRSRRSAGAANTPATWVGLLSLLLVGAGCGDGSSSDTLDCRAPGVDCSLAELATASGLFLGAAVNDPNAAAERLTVGSDFNSITAENSMKWGELAPAVGQYDFRRADALAAFAQQRGVRLRGHTLVWRDQQPADLRAQAMAAADPAAQMRLLLEEHIGTVVGRYRGQVESWDVVNEPLTALGSNLDRNLFVRTLGDTYIDEAFAMAHAADPQALLFLNEFFLVHDAADSRVGAFRDLVVRLLERGVPIDGVGIQGHFYGLLAERPARAALEGMLRSFADLGLLVEITELDISLNYFLGEADPLLSQARAYADVFAACLAVEGCRGITTWGVHDGDTWLDTFAPFHTAAPHFPLLFDAALQPKPAHVAVRQILRQTRTSGS